MNRENHARTIQPPNASLDRQNTMSRRQSQLLSATTEHIPFSPKAQAVLDDAAQGSKRKRDLAEGMQLAQKRAKPDTVDLDAELNVLASAADGDGAILLDDD